MTLDPTREARWTSEASFFDEEANTEAEALTKTHPSELRRYRGPSYRRRFSKEFRFRVLGDLAGKRVLDVGCGSGENAALFALMGARVAGVDVSPRAIELARRRLSLNGVEDRGAFVCSPVEKAQFAPNSFDIIWCSAFLHHVIDDLPLVLDRVVRWAKPDGLLVFSEPTILSEALRWLRKLVPLGTSGTPDERPLERDEVALILAHLRDPNVRPFGFLGRFVPYLVSDPAGYEQTTKPRRAAADVLYGLDWALLSLPAVRKLAGSLVLYGAPNKQRLGPAG